MSSKITILTKDHKPDVDSEKSRILSSGGKIFKYKLIYIEKYQSNVKNYITVRMLFPIGFLELYFSCDHIHTFELMNSSLFNYHHIHTFDLMSSSYF